MDLIFGDGASVIDSFVDINVSANAGFSFTGNGGFAVGGLASISSSLPTSLGTVTQATSVIANAVGGSTNANGATGGAGSGGEADIDVIGGGSLQFGDVFFESRGTGGNSETGLGGEGTGGVGGVNVENGSTVTLLGALRAEANGQGGDGATGGRGLGGLAGANVLTGLLDIRGLVDISANAIGGSANADSAGNGGDGFGGTAALLAQGTLTDTAQLIIAGPVTATANGDGGDGADSTSPGTLAGQGGNGFGGDLATVNVVDPEFPNGVLILAGADNGSITVGGSTIASANGRGGNGGDRPGGETPGAGGSATGGGALAGVGAIGLFGGVTGAVGLGTIDLADLRIDVSGVGGSSGQETQGSLGSPFNGQAGDGVGGETTLQIVAGTATIGSLFVNADGVGGRGAIGAQGTGGGGQTAGVGGISILGGLAGSLNLGDTELLARGRGSAFGGSGASGTGGLITVDGSGANFTFTGDLRARADGLATDSSTGQGGDGFGGEVELGVLSGQAGALTVQGFTELTASGFGGDSGDPTLAGGEGRGGAIAAESGAGGTVTLASGAFSSRGRGGDGLTGGLGVGGGVTIEATGAGSSLTIQQDVLSSNQNFANEGALANASGTGGASNVVGGTGGEGNGGLINLSAVAGATLNLPGSPSATNPVGAVRLLASGQGGASFDGGVGGAGVGGVTAIGVDGDGAAAGETSITMGRSQLVSTGFGGNGVSGSTNSDAAGGSGTGGQRAISVTSGGVLNIEMPFSGAQGIGGAGVGDGAGGDGVGGLEILGATAATINVTGELKLGTDSIGGSGGAGGNGTGGRVDAIVENSTIAFAPSASSGPVLVLDANGTGGAGSLSDGGAGQGGRVDFQLRNSTFTGGTLIASSDAFGGSGESDSGAGGTADGGIVSIDTNPSIITAEGGIFVSARAVGGSANEGGDASGGDASVTFTGTDITINPVGSDPSVLDVSTDANGGLGLIVGDAFAGDANVTFVDSSLLADELGLSASATGANPAPSSVGGDAFASTAALQVDGLSTIEVTDLAIRADAIASDGGSASAGTAILGIGSGSTSGTGDELIEASTALITADAESGPDDFAEAGIFNIELLSGTLSVGDLTGSALGNNASASTGISTLVASDGVIDITGFGQLDALADIEFGTINAGSLTASDLSVSGSFVTILGDNLGFADTFVSFLDISAGDLEVLAPVEVDFVSIFGSAGPGAPATLGGTSQGPGFTLTEQELNFFQNSAGNGVSFSFATGEILGGSDPLEPDIVLLDATLNGAGEGGFGDFSVGVGDFTNDEGGIIRVQGIFRIRDIGRFLPDSPAPSFNISASDRIEIVTPGALRIEDSDRLPAGFIVLDAGDIWIADATTIAQLQADPNFAGRNDVLNTAAPGSEDPLGYLSAEAVRIGVGNSLLVRNTGTATEQGGITVGDGGEGGLLQIGRRQDDVNFDDLDVFAFGAFLDDNGQFITGETFFNQVDFNDNIDTGSTTYTDESAFNECLINTGTCGAP
ncbi:MAG: hypothetical protein HRT64_07755, partial [Erythrobacter sp.]|nr:hypothetical protein [Erythrobacter sp.]